MKNNDIIKKIISSASEIYLWYDKSQARITADEIRACESWVFCPGYCDGTFSPAGNDPRAVLTLKRVRADSIEDFYLYAEKEGEISLIMEVDRDLWERLSNQGMTWYAQKEEEE